MRSDGAFLVVLPEAAWADAFVSTPRVVTLRLPNGQELEKSVPVIRPSAALPEMLRRAPRMAAPEAVVDAVLGDPETEMPLCTLETGEAIHRVSFHHIDAAGNVVEEFCYDSLGDELPMVWLVMPRA